MGSSNRQWNDLSYDLLESIVLRLSILDYSSFSRVCRSWRHVLLGNMSKHLSLELKGSWLIAYENDGSHRCYFHDLTNSRDYTQEFPELHGTICLASRYGWSLMCSGKSTFFFFNFFSRQRIALPELKPKKLKLYISTFFSRKKGDYKNGHLAAGFSNPTSADCAVAIIRRIDNCKIEISICIRGQKAWTTRIRNIPADTMGKISGSLVQKDLIYIFAETGGCIGTWYIDAVGMRSNDHYMVHPCPRREGTIQALFIESVERSFNFNVPTILQSFEARNIVVLNLEFRDLYEKVIRRIPSLESWSESSSSYGSYHYPWIFVSLCPFVLTHSLAGLASSSHPSPQSTRLWTYRCASAPAFTSHYLMSPREGPETGFPHLQVFYVEPLDLFQA